MARIPLVTLPGTTVACSRFIFGTASLFNVGAQAKRLALLVAAVEEGFTHFDTAPYYGFGWAERDLGLLCKLYPHVTITTKVGIYSPGGEDMPYAAVLLRKAAGRLLPAISRPTVDFSLVRAKRMLEDSLGRLARDHVEIYLLHEPELHLVQTDEWQRWLEDEVACGRIGSFGLALEARRLIPFLTCNSELASVIQVLDSLERREADCLLRAGRPLQVTYGYVSASRASHSRLSVAQILTEATFRNREGAIIVSTTSAGRLPQYRRVLEAGG